MGALRDPKLEKFAQALYSNLASGMKRSKAADTAAEVAGYTGVSRAPNARKRANRSDVKARLAELGAPQSEREAERIAATKEWAIARLASIANPDLGERKIKVSDQIAALKALAEIEGWKAAEKSDGTLTVVVKGGLPEQAAV